MRIKYIHPHLFATHQWWSTLSINEMKALVEKHHAPLSLSHVQQVDSRMVEMYEAEHGLEHTKGTYE